MKLVQKCDKFKIYRICISLEGFRKHRINRTCSDLNMVPVQDFFEARTDPKSSNASVTGSVLTGLELIDFFVDKI